MNAPLFGGAFFGAEMEITQYFKFKPGDYMIFTNPAGTRKFFIDKIFLYDAWSIGGEKELCYIGNDGVKYTASMCEPYIPTKLEKALK